MHNCPECNTEVEIGIKFCSKCGMDLEEAFILEPVCPKCRKTYPDGTIFCSEDGSKLVSKEKMIPKCILCNTAYSDEIKFCPKDGGEVTVEAFKLEESFSKERKGSVKFEGGLKNLYQVKSVGYIKQGWEILNQNIGMFIGFTLIWVIITVIFYQIQQTVLYLDFKSIAMGLIIVISVYVVTAAINVPLMAGFIIVAFKTIKNQQIKFKDFFKGFEYFFPLFLCGIVMNILVTIGTILLLIPGIYLTVSYLFVTPLLLDRKLDFWQAMEGSRKLITVKWFSVFGFCLFLILINTLGALPYFVGLLITIPLSACALAIAYDDIVGIESKSF